MSRASRLRAIRRLRRIRAEAEGVDNPGRLEYLLWGLGFIVRISVDSGGWRASSVEVTLEGGWKFTAYPGEKTDGIPYVEAIRLAVSMIWRHHLRNER